MDITGRFPSARGRLFGSLQARIVAAAVGGCLVLGLVGFGVWSRNASSEQATSYLHARQQLQAQLAAARQEGYTDQDLRPVLSKYSSLGPANTAWWIPGQVFYLQSQTRQTLQLQDELRALEQRVLAQSRSDADKQLGSAKSEVARAQKIGASDGEVRALQQRMTTAAADQGAARTVRDYRAVSKETKGILADATTLYTQTQQENQAILQAAQQMVTQTGGNLGAIQAAGIAAATNGRNDASVAGYLNRLNPLKGFSTIESSNSRLEKYAPLVGSGDVNQAAQGAAGVQRYAGQIHQTLVGGMPAKTVIISFSGQHLWAYQNGQVGMETPVTTGIRGDTAYGTDFGAMKIVHKEHPWTMHSPFPKGSPYWYPDTPVQYATFFTRTGESIHDADWEPDSQLGPGSQYDASTRSHGCVHVPLNDAVWMYNYAVPGSTVVVVYPGDGSPMASQMTQITTNVQGIPNSSQ
jgi:lipoprotein-anchoring transpeptidase ErfK/SrfK